jgi:asparagine synthase (glutamine-hydrolysing)
MCGIAGAFGALSQFDTGRIASDIIDEIRYRGPDGDGVENFPHGFLIHLRLSIIDVSEGGSQPKWSAGRRYCTSYNGEIYNYRELKSELIALGHSFSTDSDTEVLVKLWEVWGSEGLKRAIGMYAFAMVDTVEQRLYLARDAYGIKPLYVAEVDGGLRFASTYSALNKFPDCPRRVNARRAFEFARYGMIDKRDGTLVDGVRVVLPGTIEVFDISQERPKFLSRQAHTTITYGAKPSGLSFDDAADELREAFLLSVKLHLRSDVPIGFALSGGIDSSSIVCAARLLEPEAELKTFTYRSDDASTADGHDIDETPWAKIVSDYTKATPYIVSMTKESVIKQLEDTVRTHGFPTASMSPLAQLNVFRAAHEAGVTVMLDGQGADEMFAGYFPQMGAALGGYVRRREFAKAAKFISAAEKIPRMRWWTPVAWALDNILPPSVRRSFRSVAGYSHAPDWINSDWVRAHTGGGLGGLGPHFDQFGADVLGERLCYDLTELVLPDLLLYEDRNSMRYSIESRVPFLAAPITDIAYSVPSEYHMGTDAVSKRLFRAAMRGILPDEIRLRQDKVGFEVPQGTMLHSEREQIERLLCSDAARSIKLFSHERMLRAWRAIDSASHRDYMYVWRWIGLILWTNTFQIDWS